LSNLPVTFRDLELFDETMAHSLRLMISQRGVEDWGLDFSEFPGCEERQVTDSNKEEYIHTKIRYCMLLKRLEQLKAIKRGFETISDMKSQLALFSWKELMLLCCGADYIDPGTVISLLKFRGFSIESSTPTHLTSIIENFNNIQLRKFVEFATGQCGLNYAPSKEPFITIQKVNSSMDALPVSHVCSFTIDIPDYNDRQLFESKLLQAFEYYQSSGFHYV